MGHLSRALLEQATGQLRSCVSAPTLSRTVESPRIVRIGFALIVGCAILQGLTKLVAYSETLGIVATILVALLYLPERTPEWIKIAVSVVLLSVLISVVMWLIASRSDPLLRVEDWIAEKRLRLLGVWVYSALVVFSTKQGAREEEADRLR